MELMLILKVLLRRWWLIAIPTVMVGLWVAPDLLDNTVAPSSGFTTTFRYTAGQEREAFEAIDGDLQDVWEASFKLVDAFTEWAKTSSFREEIAAVTAGNGLEINTDALGIAPDNERAVGQISLSWHDADELATIADAVIEVLQTRNQAYFEPQLGGTPAQVILLDQPQIAPAPPPLTDRFGPLVRLAVAFMAGVGLAVLVEYLDPTLREKDDLRRMGISIVGSIPRG
jgi:capsular polysaccharide biosynthesis protein